MESYAGRNATENMNESERLVIEFGDTVFLVLRVEICNLGCRVRPHEQHQSGTDSLMHYGLASPVHMEFVGTWFRYIDKTRIAV